MLSSPPRFEKHIETFLATHLQFLQHAPDAILLLKPHGIIEYANESALKVFNCKPDELLSLSITSLLHDTISFDLINQKSISQKNKLFRKLVFQCPSGKKISLCAGIMRLQSEVNTLSGWMIIVKRNTSDCSFPDKENYSLIHCLINQYEQSACIIKNFYTGEILFVNDAFHQISGWTTEELISGGIPFFYSLLFSQNHSYHSGMKKLSEYLHPVKIEKNINKHVKLTTTLQKKNSATINVEIKTEVLHQKIDHLNHALAISLITEVKEHFSPIIKINHKRNLPLTMREKDVVKFLSLGHSTKMIAGNLKLGENYINNVRKRLLKKYNVNNSSELIHLLTREGHIVKDRNT